MIPWLPSGAFDPVSQFSQLGKQQIPMLPLDFNRPVFYSPACAAALLEFLSKFFKRISRHGNACNNSYSLAFTSFCTTGYTNNSVPLWSCRFTTASAAIHRIRTIRAYTALGGRIDQAVFRLPGTGNSFILHLFSRGVLYSGWNSGIHRRSAEGRPPPGSSEYH